MANSKDTQYTVAKSNEIIRNSRYSLSIHQQKMLLYMIGKIKPQDTGNETYIFNIQDFCAAIGVEQNSSYYTTLKKQIKELRDSSVWIKVGKKEILLAWLNTVEINSGSGTIAIKFHESVQPYLFELKERYTSYRLNEVLIMRSKYSLRLYEILKSYAYGSDFENYKEIEKDYSPSELMTLLDAKSSSYGRFFNFRQRVLAPAISEINETSEEIHIEMKEQSKGRAVVNVKFIITAASAKQIMNARKKKNDIYSKGATT